MRTLDTGYTSEVDSVDKHQWYGSLLKFNDATFYQTWSFGAVRWGEKNFSHLILKKDDSIVSMAQLRIVKVKNLNVGAAYLNWGPVWRSIDQKSEIMHLKNMLRALYIEYVDLRGLMLRILPKIIPEPVKEAVLTVFTEEEYNYSPDPQQTVVVDLSPNMDNLRKNLPKGIRHSLNAAAKNDLEFYEIQDDKSFAIVLRIFNEMQQRKNFTAFGSPEEIIAVYKDLANTVKQKMILCKHDGEAVAIIGWQTIGQYGFPLVACTGNKALKLKAGTLLFWKMIEWYKENGYLCCDLAGVNPRRNPGGYFFKKSLAGRSYVETPHYIGQFDAYNNLGSFILMKSGFYMRDIYRTIRSDVSTWLKLFKKTDRADNNKSDE